jgi:hypothetical protein
MGFFLIVEESRILFRLRPPSTLIIWTRTQIPLDEMDVHKSFWNLNPTLSVKVLHRMQTKTDTPSLCDDNSFFISAYALSEIICSSLCFL